MITAGVRPEHIVLNDTGEFSGTVDISEMLGSNIHLHVTSLNTEMIIAAQTMNLMRPSKNFVHGKEIHYSLDGGYIHLFSKETEKNLEYC